MPEATAAPVRTAPRSEPRVEGPRVRTSARGDLVYWSTLYGVALVFLAVCGVMLYFTIQGSLPAWEHSGLGLITGSIWSPGSGDFGALPLIAGTLETSAIALIFGVPLGILVAIAIVHQVPTRLRTPLSSFVELLAAIPSIVYGFIGLVIISPWAGESLFPWLQSSTHNFVLFSGLEPAGPSVLLAGIVLFVMVLPTIVAFSRDAIAAVPHELVEGGLSLGATRWQTIFRIVLPAARTGIIGAVTLAAARALGETIAVSMVIGGAFTTSRSLLLPGNTIAAAIATGWDDATALTHSAFLALAIVLIVITATINWIGRSLIARGRKGATL